MEFATAKDYFSVDVSCVMRMNVLFLFGIVLLAIMVGADSANNSSSTSSKILSRKKRFMAFPEGSSFSAAICTTIGMIGNPVVEYLSWAVNWGVSYDLPNQTWIRHHSNGFKTPNNSKPVTKQRRDRRELYRKIEIAIDNCIARAICESTTFFSSEKGSMIEELLKVIFKFPLSRVQSDEPEASHVYDRIARKARYVDNSNYCEEQYSACHFSLLELALGKYSRTPVELSPTKAIPFM